MAEIETYVSTTMETGSQVKEALDRISAYIPAAFVWIEIPEGVSIDLSNPTASDAIRGPGDYTIYTYINGPSGVVNTPLNVNIRQKPGSTTEYILHVFDGLNSYLKDGSSDWEEAVIEDSSALSIYRGKTSPDRTDIFWLDTSNYNNGTGYIDLKYYNGTSWVSVFQADDLMFGNTYDTAGYAKDIFSYVDAAIAKVDGHVADFNDHVNNKLTLIHVTSDKKNQYNTTLLTTAQVTDLLANTYKSQLEQTVTTQVETTTKVEEYQDTIDTAKESFTAHVNTHITDDDADNWDKKATGDHRHDLDGNIKIKASDIISGVFPISQIPDSVKERYYKLSSLDEFADTSITDDDRNSKYHNGNGFALDTNTIDSYGNKIFRWFRIIDQTKIGTSNWESGVCEFTNTIPDFAWENVADKPTTLAGYGLNDEAYTETEVNNLIATPKANYDSNQDQYDILAGTVEIPCSGAGIPASGVTISKVGIQQALSSGAKTYTDLRGDYDVIVLMSDGTVYKTTDKDDLRLGFSWVKTYAANTTYFNNRFAGYYTSDSANALWTSDGLGKCYPATATPVNIAFTVGSTNYIMRISTSGISFFMSYEVALKCVMAINNNVSADLEKIDTDLAAAYEKWGYPAGTEAVPTVLTGDINVNLSVGTLTIIRMPELTS